MLSVNIIWIPALIKGHHGTFVDFLSHSKVPKFSAANRVNVTMFQSYHSVLEGLTAVEECL